VNILVKAWKVFGDADFGEVLEVKGYKIK